MAGPEVPPRGRRVSYADSSPKSLRVDVEARENTRDLPLEVAVEVQRAAQGEGHEQRSAARARDRDKRVLPQVVGRRLALGSGESGPPSSRSSSFVGRASAPSKSTRFDARRTAPATALTARAGEMKKAPADADGAVRSGASWHTSHMRALASPSWQPRVRAETSSKPRASPCVALEYSLSLIHI